MDDNELKAFQDRLGDMVYDLIHDGKVEISYLGTITLQWPKVVVLDWPYDVMRSFIEKSSLDDIEAYQAKVIIESAAALDRKAHIEE